MTVEIVRTQDSLRVKLQVPEEIETFFMRQGDREKQQSGKWKVDGNGAQFWKIGSGRALAEFLNANKCFNDYGDGLFNADDKINIAPLRTVGATDGVTLTADTFNNVTCL